MKDNSELQLTRLKHYYNLFVKAAVNEARDANRLSIIEPAAPNDSIAKVYAS